MVDPAAIPDCGRALHAVRVGISDNLIPRAKAELVRCRLSLGELQYIFRDYQIEIAADIKNPVGSDMPAWTDLERRGRRT